jgi:hypothetical protein
MRVAVLSLTRDRLAFTQHCFGTLREKAGCDFDHYVLDQGSQDGTFEWLKDEYRRTNDVVIGIGDNIGVSRGINKLLDDAVPNGYDVIVKVDNDCELVRSWTLDVAARVALEGWIVSPHIQGLDSPPTVEREEWVAGYKIGVPNIMGGIFMAAPAVWYEMYRHDESNPVWGMDDAKIVDSWRAFGGEVGYLLDFPAFHHLTTQGQREADPQYFARKDAEYAR